MYNTIGISDDATASGFLGLLLHIVITVFLSSTIGAARKQLEVKVSVVDLTESESVSD